MVQNKWLETALTHHVTLNQHHHVIMGLYSLREKPGEASVELWKCFSVQNSAVLIAEGKAQPSSSSQISAAFKTWLFCQGLQKGYVNFA